MAKVNAPFLSFNQGIVSPLSLARVDIQRLRFAAEEQTNWVPRTLGPMSIRPGLQWIGETFEDNRAFPIPFVFASDDTAILEIAGGYLWIRIDDVMLTRPAVTAVITNGLFDTTGGWTFAVSGGATGEISGDLLRLTAFPLGSRVVAEQQVTINEPGIEHALRINIYHGSVRFRVGTVSGADDLVPASELDRGIHSLAFIPPGSLIFVQFESRRRWEVSVGYCVFEQAAAVQLVAPWVEADYPLIRYAQSADTVYLACDNAYPPMKIERRATRSWSLCFYEPEDGPVKPAPTDKVILTPSGTAGTITIASDIPFFRPEMTNSLLRITTRSQVQTTPIGAENTFTEPIRVTGVSSTSAGGGLGYESIFITPGGAPGGSIVTPTTPAAPGGSRKFLVTVEGAYGGTLTLQRSFDSDTFGFTDVQVVAAGTIEYEDTFDNSIVWYRVGFKIGEYGGGVPSVTLNYPGGGYSGIARIEYVSSQLANADMLFPLSAAVPTDDWQEGEWSDLYGWPSSVVLFEGRLWWFGADRIWGSVSDAYESFDIALEGDAASIGRSIGYGPVENIHWALPLARLMIGTASSEIAIRSSAFDEPLSPTNFALRDASGQGTAKIAAVKIDQRGIFVQRSKRKIFQLLYSVETQDYTSNDLTALLPDLDEDFTFVVVQRQPDTRVHCGRADGTVLVLVYEPVEEVVCWYKVVTNGQVEAAVVLPGTPEDQVYYYVNRTVDGETRRFLEKYAMEEDCLGRPVAYLLDSFLRYSDLVSEVIAVPHLEGRTVNVWAWNDASETGTDFAALGEPTGEYVVTGGFITIPEFRQNVVVGLGYSALFQSAKLAYGAQAGTALVQKKRVDHIGVILKDTHGQGLEMGSNINELDKMQKLPRLYRGVAIDADHIYESFDQPSIPINGIWDTDSRLALLANSPRPATVMAAIISMVTNER